MSADPVLVQVFLNAVLDAAWTLLPGEVLEQLAYV